jgi:hypothetical protein
MKKQPLEDACENPIGRGAPRTLGPKGLIAVAVVPVLLGLAVQAGMGVRRSRDASPSIGTLNLDGDAKIVPPDATLVRVTGKRQEKIAYELATKEPGSNVVRSRDFYEPLTAQNWSRNQPVEFVLKYELTHGATAISLEDGILVGEVTRQSLPAYVMRAWAKEGLYLAPSILVLEHRRTNGGKVVSQHGNLAYEKAPYIGLLLGCVLLCTALAYNARVRKRSGS